MDFGRVVAEKKVYESPTTKRLAQRCTGLEPVRPEGIFVKIYSKKTS